MFHVVTRRGAVVEEARGFPTWDDAFFEWSGLRREAQDHGLRFLDDAYAPVGAPRFSVEWSVWSASAEGKPGDRFHYSVEPGDPFAEQPHRYRVSWRDRVPPQAALSFRGVAFRGAP